MAVDRLRDRGFDALEEDFFRDGETLAEQPFDDLSDLEDDTAPTRSLGVGRFRRLAGRPRRPKQIAIGTPAPELIAPKPPVTHRARRHFDWRLLAGASVAAAIAVVAVAIPGETTATVPPATAAPAAAPAATMPASAPAPVPAPVVAAAPAPLAKLVPTKAPRPAKARLAAKPTRAAVASRSAAESHYAEATRHYRSGNVGRAAREFRAAIKANPGHAASYRGLGLASRRAGHRAEAVKALKRYLKLAPRARDAKTIRKVLRDLGA